MAEPRWCPECAAELPGDAPENLCPKCLLQQALSDSDVDAAGEPSPATGAYEGRFTPPSPADLAVHFPQLEILELLGQGGMGAVYKARQRKLDRLVALKIMPPQASADPAFAQRFGREARALARLSHPNIVAVHDYGEAGGLYYFIMEYVNGLNLRQLMQASPMEPQEALHVIPQICDALQYAHEAEIVHRDIKPENILLDQKGRVKIADFGLAKLLGRVPAGYTLTGSHQVMGTPHYMAPEQMEKPQSVDHRADIYSLGVVFYEMLTGELPLGRFASPSAKAEVDGRLDQVVLRALEKEPGQRYQRVSEVKTDVEAIVRTAPEADRTHRAAIVELDREMVRYRVMAPAAGLLFTAFLAFVSWAGIGLFTVNEFGWRLREHEVHGDATWPLQHLWLLMACLSVLLVLAACGLLAAGAENMMRLRSYAIATTACIWAMMPWSLGFLVGLPFGIWGLVVLRKPEVRAAFLGRRSILLPGGPGIMTPPGNPVLRRMRSFARGVRNFALDSQEPPSEAVAVQAVRPLELDRPLKLSAARHEAGAKEVMEGHTAHPVPRPEQLERPDPMVRDLCAVLGMVGILATAALLLWLLDMPEAVIWWPVIPFAGYYLWQSMGGSYRGRVLAGVVGLFGVIALAGLSKRLGLWDQVNQWMWYTPWLGIWFFSWMFNPGATAGQQSEEEAAAEEEGKADGPVHGLTDEEAAVWRRLKRFSEKTDLTFHLAPDLPAEVLATSRKTCRVPPDERILGIIDFTGNENGDNVLVIGCRGIYYHNLLANAQPGPGTIPYADFSKRVFTNHGREVFLGNEQFLYTDPDQEVDCEQVANLLNALRQAASVHSVSGT
jgi:tRNA A-37 threonylcarbamoyl transferase component Bud32